MRVLIISDSHGETKNFISLKKKAGKVNLVIHCGDGEEDFDYIRDYFKCEFWAVSGNMDSMSREPRVIDRVIEGKKIHIEHGDNFKDISYKELIDYAKDSGYDVVLFGHRHELVIKHEDGVWVVNPGSIARPKDGFPSYIILETDGNGNFNFTGERM